MTKITLNKFMSTCWPWQAIPHAALESWAVGHELRSASFIAAEGCYFHDYLYEKRGNAVRSSFQDATGYECYVNHIHIDDFSGGVLGALSLCSYLEGKWLLSKYKLLTLRQIVSFEDAGLVHRFHVARAGQSWLADDLSGYDEMILVFDTYPG